MIQKKIEKYHQRNRLRAEASALLQIGVTGRSSWGNHIIIVLVLPL